MAWQPLIDFLILSSLYTEIEKYTHFYSLSCQCPIGLKCCLANSSTKLDCQKGTFPIMAGVIALCAYLPDILNGVAHKELYLIHF